MKIALLGYGKMAREIEKAATDRHHEIVLRIDIDNVHDLTEVNLHQADVAIDFSTPASAFSNIMKCFDAGIPVVCGTTGWLDKIGEVKQECMNKNGTFFYASNFSLGMNIFFAVNKYLATVMNNFGDYNVGIKEIHHIHKVDAPSGTAISLANDIIGNYEMKNNWELDSESSSSIIKITAVRENEVPGTHIITWDSSVDRIEIMHEAKNRKGLALGALMAAEFVRDKKGVYSMADLINL
jgi:4-hydroxy-tetrahydrodipicolinate reductase